MYPQIIHFNGMIQNPNWGVPVTLSDLYLKTPLTAEAPTAGQAGDQPRWKPRSPGGPAEAHQFFGGRCVSGKPPNIMRYPLVI